MSSPFPTIKQLRRSLRFSQTRAAALAKVSPTSWRVYEIDPSQVSEPVRAACDGAAREMLAIARADGEAA